MNSFFIPQLGSQIYTMAGMTTELSLQADHPGVYPGLSAQFSGDGFSDMKFDMEAMAPADFDKWVAATKAEGKVLDANGYAALAQESKAVTPFSYRAVDPGLFDRIVAMRAPEGEAPHGGPSPAISPRTPG
jgi:cytochrome o ubiquinol oxidase subunit 2